MILTKVIVSRNRPREVIQMNEENELIYFKGGLALGVGLGLVGGIASTLFYHKKKTISADLVLENVKAAFLKEGPIEGSWIEFEKKPLRKFAIHSKTYTGGICRIEDDGIVQYEFTADAYTGTVIDIQRLKD
ncbi:peptidase propeptide and YPEB domain protein [Enterococcus faecalis TX0043]|nr:peptidase propeptide and YPEB domain protein [Enterococcus faecalis TX0043]